MMHSNNNTCKVIVSHNKFSSDLYQYQIAKKKRTNIVISPVSIFISMLMVASGGNGETFNEIVKGIGYENIPRSIEEWRQEIELFAFNYFSNLNNSILNMANNLFVDKSCHVNDEYKEHLKKAFQVNLTQCDFRRNSSKETDNINEWVSQKTCKLIKNLIKPEMINDLTRFVLVNAVHFLGRWKNAFNKNDSYSGKFNSLDGECSCRFMRKRNTKEQYGKEGDYQWVTIPFSDNKYKMTIIAQQKSQSKLFDSWVAQKISQGIETALPTDQVTLSTLAFPCFQIEYRMEIDEILKANPFNMKNSFTNTADFSNLVENEKIFINKFIHKASIKVDEYGAEASAASAVIGTKWSSDSNEVSFIVDSPFTFVLSDDSSKTILFVGKVNKL